MILFYKAISDKWQALVKKCISEGNALTETYQWTLGIWLEDLKSTYDKAKLSILENHLGSGL